MGIDLGNVAYRSDTPFFAGRARGDMGGPSTQASANSQKSLRCVNRFTPSLAAPA